MSTPPASARWPSRCRTAPPRSTPAPAPPRTSGLAVRCLHGHRPRPRPVRRDRLRRTADRRLPRRGRPRRAPASRSAAARASGWRRVRDGLPEPARDWPLVVADTSDAGAVRELATSTTAVATTVGPYARYGLPLVEACAAAGTHYADLTGEVPFVRASADRAHERARETGARITHACGFDSVPSDLAALLTAQAARAAHAHRHDDGRRPACPAASAAARSTRCAAWSTRSGATRRRGG